ncbi:hypothetical protein VZ169_19310, partial [Acinetobacter baumannii]
MRGTLCLIHYHLIGKHPANTALPSDPISLNLVLTNDSTPALTGTVNDPTATVVVNVDGVDYPAV